MAESSNISFRQNDSDKRSIHQFLGDYLPGLKVCDMTKLAAHAGVYKALLKKLPEDFYPDVVVVTLNLRSFNAQWIYSKLETELQKSLVLLRDYPPLVNRFLLSFKAYDNKTEEERKELIENKWRRRPLHAPEGFPHQNTIEWDQWMARHGFFDSTGKRNQALTELACHYIKGYAFQIDPSAKPRIKDFDEIVRLAEERGWKLVFNLMAENVEKAAYLVGNELVNMMEYNAEFLTRYYEKKGVLVVNNLSAVPDEQFIDQAWTTEHYAELGRKAIAENLANSLKKHWLNGDPMK